MCARREARFLQHAASGSLLTRGWRTFSNEPVAPETAAGGSGTAVVEASTVTPDDMDLNNPDKQPKYIEFIRDNMVKNFSGWYTNGSPLATAVFTFVFVVFIIAMLIWYIIAYIIMKQDIWNNGMKNWFKVASSLCKFCTQIILAINSMFCMKLLNMVSKCSSANKTVSKTVNENNQEIPTYFLLVSGVMSLLPSSVNLLLLLITYGFLKATSQMKLGRSSNQENNEVHEAPSGVLYLIEYCLTFFAIFLLLSYTVVFIGYKSKQASKQLASKLTGKQASNQANDENTLIPLIGIIVSILFIFYSNILDKLIYAIVFYPMNYINNYSKDDDNCIDNSVIKFVICIIWLVLLVFIYLILFVIYGIGSFDPSVKKTRLKIYAAMVDSLDTWLVKIQPNCIKKLKLVLLEPVSKDLGQLERS